MRRAVASEVRPTEELLWVGQPARGVVFAGHDLLMVPATTFLGGLATFAGATILVSAPLVAFLVFLPFLALIHYLMWGRFIVAARHRARTFYAITDRRALIVVEGSTRSVLVLDLAAQHSFAISEGRRGRGTITFVLAPWISTFDGGLPAQSAPRFEDIANVREVRDRICALREEWRPLPIPVSPSVMKRPSQGVIVSPILDAERERTRSGQEEKGN